MSTEAVPLPPSYRRIYVSWHEQWTLQRYVDNYLSERGVPVNDAMRAKVNQRIDKYPGRGALKKADIDYYLDAHASEFSEHPPRVPLTR